MLTEVIAGMVAIGILAHSLLLLRDDKVQRVSTDHAKRLRKLETAVFDKAEHARPPIDADPAAG